MCAYQIPIDLCDISTELASKLIITNIITKVVQTILIKDGIALSESDLNEDIKQNLNLKPSQIPQVLVQPQLNSVLISSVDLDDGLFLKLNHGIIYNGTHFIGMPVGENIQHIVIKKNIAIINGEPFEFKLDEKLVFVKNIDPKLKEKQVLIKNQGNSTSRKHATLEYKVQGFQISDGYLTSKSQNGIWCVMSSPKVFRDVSSKVAFLDFRLLLSLSY